MIEVAIALAACAALAGLLWWYDSRGATEWEDLFSAEDAHEFLREKFAAEQRALDGTCERAAAAECPADSIRLLAAGAAFLAGLVPDRVALLGRLHFYSRLMAALGPVPALRVLALRRRFERLSGGRSEADWLRDARGDFHALNEETLESWRLLLATLGRVRVKE